MKKTFLWIGLWACLALGCHKNGKEEDLRQSAIVLKPHQIGSYSLHDSKALMEAIAKVLQEQGFTVKTIHYDLGFVSASKRIDKTEADKLVSENYREEAPNTLEVTANILPQKEGAQVKIHFVTKTFDSSGIVRALEMVSNQEIYQDFFDKISNYVQPTKETAAKSRPEEAPRT